MTLATARRLLKNEWVQTAVMIVLIVIIVFGLWFVVQVVLHTQYPALAVATGSMCKLPGNDCDGWSHPFERTLHVGDLIIVQGVRPEEIHTGPEPEGDVIVFQPTWAGGDLIVHRAIGVKNESGHLSFVTKGDGNTGADPDETSSDRVFGKVVMRIPWVGRLSLFMRNSSLAAFVIVLLIIVLVIVEIIVPSYTRRKSVIEEAAKSESTLPSQSSSKLSGAARLWSFPRGCKDVTDGPASVCKGYLFSLWQT